MIKYIGNKPKKCILQEIHLTVTQLNFSLKLNKNVQQALLQYMYYFITDAQWNVLIL